MLMRHKSFRRNVFDVLVTLISLWLIGTFFFFHSSSLNQKPSRIHPRFAAQGPKKGREMDIAKNENHFPENRESHEKESSTNSKYEGNIILATSVGRSGSTLLSEVLASVNNAIFYFEPAYYIKKVYNPSCLKDDECSSNFVKSIFRCNYDSQFEKWFHKKNNFNVYFSKSFRGCIKEYTRSGCMELFDFRKACRRAKVRVIKTIRIPIFYLENLIKDDQLPSKIIYLTRDPRAVYSSIQKMGWAKAVEGFCTVMLNDIKAYKIYKAKYPSRILWVTYENISLDPLNQIKRIFKFIYNDENLPQETQDYVMKHMLVDIDKKGALNTVRNSSSHFDAWRWEIKPDDFKTMENLIDCRRSLQHMNYRLFNNTHSLKNKELSLFH